MPEIGTPVPQFTLTNQHGEEISLEDFRGRKHVLLVFYPFAFSGVCSGELCEIRDQLGDLSNETTEVLAVSCDPMFALRAFADSEGYEFSLLSDFWPHGRVAQAYDNFVEDVGAAGRSTYVIDRDGVLRWQVTNELGRARDIEEYKAQLRLLD